MGRWGQRGKVKKHMDGDAVGKVRTSLGLFKLAHINGLCSTHGYLCNSFVHNFRYKRKRERRYIKRSEWQEEGEREKVNKEEVPPNAVWFIYGLTSVTFYSNAHTRNSQCWSVPQGTMRQKENRNQTRPDDTRQARLDQTRQDNLMILRQDRGVI